MTARTLVLTAVATGCVAAAGAGGFYAVRLGQTGAAGQTDAVAPASSPATGPTSAQAAAPADAPSASMSRAGSETPDAATAASTAERRPAPVPAPAVSAAPARTSTPATRQADPPARHERPATPPPAVTPPAAEAPPVTGPTGAGAASSPVPVLPPAVAIDPASVGASDVPVTMPPPPVERARRLVELVIPEDSVIGLRLESPLSSESAEVEDPVSARVTRDVTVDDRVAIPADARLEGVVVSVERGGRFKERARLGIRFMTLVLGDNTRVRIETDPIFRDGESPAGEATAKIGASAVVGSILGAVIGGKKGAAIGGAAGAAGGTAVVARGGPEAAVFAAGAPLTVRLSRPVTLLVEREPR